MTSLPAEDTLELLDDEVDDLVVVALQLRVSLDPRQGVVDDGEEHAHQADRHDGHVEEEEDRSHELMTSTNSKHHINYACPMN